ncbi:conserved hypothetical protein [Histoplasma capsulatum H143]|uniref:Uncharacterized protein n=1 Tax=Ajellomyces capsulatus (strain H143) TaxID=544712 RepID=C6HKN5_AJECH|nr:conserved hypothetical protein [Histoplasma capsulatum H143]
MLQRPEQVFIEYIRTNDWSPAASDCQVLPAKVKDTITTIGELSILDSTTLPQTRDTLTAEVLLDGFKSPLDSIMLTSQISVGQLSSEAEVLNLQLYQAFETASHGKALLLLNEADVFL